MQIKQITKSILPTPWGKFILIIFKENLKIKKHIILLHGKKKSNYISIRIHSKCVTGDTLFSLRCDCGIQLKKSFKNIAKNKYGILIYHEQEGRNIGLVNKIKTYALQDIGFNTVEANNKLGFSIDERDYNSCINILKILGISKINLITNNPKKIKLIMKSGIKIMNRKSIIIYHNINNYKYLKIKFKTMGHLL